MLNGHLCEIYFNLCFLKKTKTTVTKTESFELSANMKYQIWGGKKKELAARASYWKSLKISELTVIDDSDWTWYPPAPAVPQSALVAAGKPLLPAWPVLPHPLLLRDQFRANANNGGLKSCDKYCSP